MKDVILYFIADLRKCNLIFFFHLLARCSCWSLVVVFGYWILIIIMRVVNTSCSIFKLIGNIQFLFKCSRVIKVVFCYWKFHCLPWLNILRILLIVSHPQTPSVTISRDQQEDIHVISRESWPSGRNLLTCNYEVATVLL